MSVEARMVHRVSVERAAPTGATDEYGQPVLAWSSVATTIANIVAKSAREVALLNQGGAVVSAITIHLPIGTDITPADRLHHDPAACPVAANDLGDVLYQLTAVRDASGAGIFLRCDATEVA